MPNFSCDDLYISGKIIFADNTQQNTSNSDLISKTAQIERNSTTSTTQILNDDLVVNNSLSVANQITTNFLNSRGVAFSDDLDNNGIPSVQNAAFSTILKNKLNDVVQNLQQIVPDIIDPPNKRMKLENPDVITTILPESLTLDYAPSGGPTLSLTPGDLTIHDNGTILQSQLTSDYLELKSFSTNSSSQYLSTGITWDSQTFSLIGNHLQDFLHFQSGKISKVEIIDTTIGNHLEPNVNHFNSEGTDCRLYEVPMYFSVTTQSYGSRDGWYCYLSNTGDHDLNLSSDDNKYFFSHSSGSQSSMTTIKKYSTVRITLIFSKSLDDYIWTISQF